MVREIGEVGEIEPIIQNGGDRLVVIDYYTSWCGPCKRLAPLIEDWAKKYPSVLFLKVNCERVVGTGVGAFPTLMFYKNGKQISKVFSLLKQ